MILNETCPFPSFLDKARRTAYNKGNTKKEDMTADVSPQRVRGWWKRTFTSDCFRFPSDANTVRLVPVKDQ